MPLARVTVILVLVAVDLTITLPQNGDSNTIEYKVTTPPPASCVTGKRVPGTCVKRERCDYGTAVIDFSLYRPRGFKELCSPEDVCCPEEYIVQTEDRVWVPENGTFDFDDDD